MKIRQTAGQYLLAGIGVLVPLAIIIFLAAQIWKFFSLLGVEGVEKLIKIKIPFIPTILAILIIVGAIFLIGVFISSGIGRRLSLWLEQKIVVKIPVIGGVIFTAKKLIDEHAPVILVEYPNKGLFQVGFITFSWPTTVNKKEMVTVFLPSAPIVTTGVIVVVLKSQTEALNISGREVIQYYIAGGGNISKEMGREITRAREFLILRREIKQLENFLERRGRIKIEPTFHNAD